MLALQGGRDPCSRYDVQLEKSGWTQWIAVNRSVRPCEQFEFREGAVTMVTEVSISGTLTSQKALLFGMFPGFAHLSF